MNLTMQKAWRIIVYVFNDQLCFKVFRASGNKGHIFIFSNVKSILGHPKFKGIDMDRKPRMKHLPSSIKEAP